jgi:hypothetical protein
MRQEGLNGQEDAGDVDGEGAAQMSASKPVREAHALVEIDARVADQKVDGAVPEPIGQRRGSRPDR